jgi:D-glycero-beta-D-manno-heptose-7-phosphate kinase
MSQKKADILFKNMNILIVGDVMIDAYLFGKVERISPEAPVPVVSVIQRDNRPGGAANVAINISSLGSTPYLCSVIGTDDKATQFVKLLEEHKLPTEGLVNDSSRPTTTKFRIIGNNMQMLRVDEESTATVSDEITQELFARIHNIISGIHIDAIIFQDYDKGVITQKLIENVVTLARNTNIPVVADPKKLNFEHYKNIALFKPNFKEFREGIKDDVTAQQPELLATMMKQYATEHNIEMMMVTLSEKGVLMVHEPSDSTFHIPAHLRKISDVSGAGDTVISVAALCLAAGESPETTARLSNLAGGIVCQYVGVVPIDKDEFFSEINRLNILK